MRITEDDFGKSMHIDLYGCDNVAIDDHMYILYVMTELIDDVLKMERFGEPFLTRFGVGDLEGYSYCQMIQTSCVTAHFAPNTYSAYIDVFSCKDYNEKAVKEFLVNRFDAVDWKTKVLRRQ